MAISKERSVFVVGLIANPQFPLNTLHRRFLDQSLFKRHRRTPVHQPGLILKRTTVRLPAYLLTLALDREDVRISAIGIPGDVNGQLLKGRALLPEQDILNKGADGVVGPVLEIGRRADLDALAGLAASAETCVRMAFARVRTAVFFVVEIDAVEEGLLHEHCESAEISAFEEQAFEARGLVQKFFPSVSSNEGVSD